jgi:hypothetical protein
VASEERANHKETWWGRDDKEDMEQKRTK